MDSTRSVVERKAREASGGYAKERGQPAGSGSMPGNGMEPRQGASDAAQATCFCELFGRSLGPVWEIQLTPEEWTNAVQASHENICRAIEDKVKSWHARSDRRDDGATGIPPDDSNTRGLEHVEVQTSDE